MPIPRKSIWYHPYRQAFFAELASTEPFDGTTLTPRDITLGNLEHNLAAVKELLHANAVCFRLQCDDSFAHQYGGGFSYDPVSRRQSEFAEAQELVVKTAAKNGLGVIFDIDFSAFHRYEDDMWGTSGHGLKDFIHSLIDPGRYYGSGFPNFIGDPRVTGWIFCGEWKPEQAKEQTFISKYWNFTYDTIHSGGAQNAWLGLYVNAGPSDGRTVCQDRIVYLKRLFAPIGPNKQPDRLGMCWYAGDGYKLSNVWNDLHEEIRYFPSKNSGHARGPTYEVPAPKVFLMEGACSATPGTPGIRQYYIDVIGTADNTHVDGINVWCDTSYQCHFDANGPRSGEAEDNRFALFNYSHLKTGYVQKLPKPPEPGWHGVQAPWGLSKEVWPVACDSFKVDSLTDVGASVRDAFDRH